MADTQKVQRKLPGLWYAEISVKGQTFKLLTQGFNHIHARKRLRNAVDVATFENPVLSALQDGESVLLRVAEDGAVQACDWGTFSESIHELAYLTRFKDSMMVL